MNDKRADNETGERKKFSSRVSAGDKRRSPKGHRRAADPALARAVNR
jgi:hypothetical protein